jgi:hypothetical protein
MKKIIWLLFALLTVAAQAQTTVFNCSSFTSTGTCGTALIGGGGETFGVVGSGGGPQPSLSGGVLTLMASGNTHSVYVDNYAPSTVNVQAFSTSFTYVANGWNLAFVAQNNTITGAAGTGNAFFAGAGCEGGFYQGFGTGNIPNNFTFAVNLDQQDYTSGSSFTYSNAMIYQPAQPPCAPNDSNPHYYQINKVSTSPVPLNSPTSTVGGVTGDTYSATITYNVAAAGELTLALYDVTAGGTCTPTSSSTCFYKVWSNVNIPSIVGSNTAWIGLSTSTNGSSSAPLYLDSWSYIAEPAPSTPPLSTYTVSQGGATAAANPTFSPAAGSYSSGQSVAITCSTGSSNICYSSLASLSSTTILPQTDNKGGCANGTAYSGAVTVSSSTTLYAMCGTTYTGPPSALVSAAYTIGGTPAASTPTFSPTSGTYTGSQSATISCSTGPVACYNFTGTPATNGSSGCSTGNLYSGPVSIGVSETLYGVCGGTGYLDGSVSNAVYVIQTASPTITLASGSYTLPQSTTITAASGSPTLLYCTTTYLGTCSPVTTYTTSLTISSPESICANAQITGQSVSGNVCHNYNSSAVSNPTGIQGNTVIKGKTVIQ